MRIFDIIFLCLLCMPTKAEDPNRDEIDCIKESNFRAGNIFNEHNLIEKGHAEKTIFLDCLSVRRGICKNGVFNLTKVEEVFVKETIPVLQLEVENKEITIKKYVEKCNVVTTSNCGEGLIDFHNCIIKLINA